MRRCWNNECKLRTVGSWHGWLDWCCSYAFIHYSDEEVCRKAHDSSQELMYQNRTLVVMYGKKAGTVVQPAPKRQAPASKRTCGRFLLSHSLLFLIQSELSSAADGKHSRLQKFLLDVLYWIKTLSVDCHCFMLFTAQRYAECGVCYTSSICLSVACVLCIKIAECIIEILSLSDRPVTLVFCHQPLLRKYDAFTTNGSAEYKEVAIFDQ